MRRPCVETNNTTALAVVVSVFWVGLEYGLVQRVDWLAERIPANTATVGVAYLLAKVLTVPRLAVTVAITPPIQAWWARRRARG